MLERATARRAQHNRLLLAREAVRALGPVPVDEAADVAEMTAFLLNPKSKWITGQIIGIDGGMSTVKMM